MKKLFFTSFIILVSSGLSFGFRPSPHHFWNEYCHRQLTVEDTLFAYVIAPLPDSSTVKMPHVTITTVVSEIDSTAFAYFDSSDSYSGGTQRFLAVCAFDDSTEFAGGTMTLASAGGTVMLKLDADNGIYVMDSTGDDTLRIYDDEANTRITSDNDIIFPAIDSLTVEGYFAGAAFLRGTGTFNGSATSDITVISGVTASSFFVVSVNDATPEADDQMSWTSTTDTLFVHRIAGTTADLAYSYIRID